MDAAGKGELFSIVVSLTTETGISIVALLFLPSADIT